MRKTKFISALGVAVMASLLVTAPSYAKTVKKPLPKPVETQPAPIDTPTTHNQRQKMPHSARKEAALRMKGLYQKARQDHLAHQGKPNQRGGR